MFNMHLLACFCGLYFKWWFNFQTPCNIILVCLVYLVLIWFPLVPAAVAWRGRVSPGHLLSLSGGRKSQVYGREEATLVQCLLWWDLSALDREDFPSRSLAGVGPPVSVLTSHPCLWGKVSCLWGQRGFFGWATFYGELSLGNAHKPPCFSGPERESKVHRDKEDFLVYRFSLVSFTNNHKLSGLSNSNILSYSPEVKNLSHISVE